MELWYSEAHSKDVKFSIKFDRQLYTEQSDFQRIDVFESKEFGRFLTLDGFMMLTEKCSNSIRQCCMVMWMETVKLIYLITPKLKFIAGMHNL